MDSETISDGIVLWTGWRTENRPRRDDQRVIDRYGQDAALDLLPVIHRLEEEFYESDARMVAADVSEMSRLARDRFHGLHPEISEEAVRALGWCYAFDYK